MAPNFDKTISTREQLRAVLGEPSPRAVSKVIDHIDVHCRGFIARSPFLLLATRAEDAAARGVPVLGRLLGWGMSSDGQGEMVSPSADGAARSMADVSPHS